MLGVGLLAFSVPQYIFNEKVCPLKKAHCFKKLKHTPFWEGLVLLVAGGAAQGIPLYTLSFEQTKVVRAPEDYEPTRVRVGCCWFKVNIGGWLQLQQILIRWLCRGFFVLGIISSVSGYISVKHKWHLRFLVSSIFIVIGLLWFMCGFPLYGPRRLQPSPLSIMLRALIAAARKRHLNYRECLENLHRGDGDDQNQRPTDQLEWLNKAAVNESGDDIGWRLCTVKEVEETKLLFYIIPMSVTFITYGMLKSLGNSFFMEQANNMRGDIPTVVFQITQEVSKCAVACVYKVVFERRIKIRMKKQYADGMKIGFGMLACIPCCAVASSVESKRLKSLSKRGQSTSPFWLVPQFFSLGVMEGLAGDGIQNFFGHYAPDSKRYGPVFARSLTGFGAVLNVGFLAVLDHYSKSTFHASWLGDSINQSRLDCIYRAYVMLALLNCFIYAYVATSFPYDNIIGSPEKEEQIRFLEVKRDEAAGGQQNNPGQLDAELQTISLS
ncbi:hypothetical protein PTKIN_Ptkin02bG0025400 [Pterospermum kingtungense]